MVNTHEFMSDDGLPTLARMMKAAAALPTMVPIKAALIIMPFPLDASTVTLAGLHIQTSMLLSIQGHGLIWTCVGYLVPLG